LVKFLYYFSQKLDILVKLAEKINAKQKSISRYETGASLPSIRTLVKIAKVLKKPVGYFLEE